MASTLISASTGSQRVFDPHEPDRPPVYRSVNNAALADASRKIDGVKRSLELMAMVAAPPLADTLRTMAVDLGDADRLLQFTP